MRDFEPALLLAYRACECAFFVSEQLALEKRFDQCGAVDGDEGLASAAAVIVDGAGHELLARAAFSKDQHIASADPDIPVLIAAKSELGKLNRQEFR